MFKRLVIYICILLVLTLGYLQYYKWQRARQTAQRQSQAEKTQVVKKINDIDLAKVILRAPSANLDVNKDPFRPLIQDTKTEQPIVQISDTNTMHTEAAINLDVQFLGMIRINKENQALLRYNQTKRLYKVNDQVDEFTIETIEKDAVSMNDGETTVTLKRGI